MIIIGFHAFSANATGSYTEQKMIQKKSIFTEGIPKFVSKIKPVITESYNPNLDWVGYRLEIYKPNGDIDVYEKKTILQRYKRRIKSRKKFVAYVTQYSRADSCHNIVDGKCLMANGRPVHEGAVACPRWLKLGTKLEINGKVYTCEDRYAKWLDKKRGLPTVDIFVEKNPHGIKKLTITIL